MELSTEQLEVINSNEPAICCLAVPGAGKTTVLVQRIKRLIESKSVLPSDVVVITYTVAAANELKSRIGEVKLGFVGTLHSYAMRELQAYGTRIGFGSRIMLMDEEIVKEKLTELCHRLDWTGSKRDVDSALRHAVTSTDDPRTAQGAELVARTWYAQMIQEGAVSYDGIIYWFIRMLRSLELPETRHVFWDEGQDMSEADYLIYKMMPTRSRFLVGDENQAIFGFRGGKPDYILQEARSGGVASYKIQTTRRFTSNIAGAANALIAHNPNQTDKLIRSDRETTELITIKTDCNTINEECQEIASACEGRSGSIGVLLPTNFLVGLYSEKLTQLGIVVSKVAVPNYPQSWRLIKMILAACANTHNDFVVATAYSWVMGTDHNELIRAAAKARKSVNEHIDWIWRLGDIPYAIGLLESVSALGPDDPGVIAVRKIAAGMDEGTPSDLLALISEIERESVKESAGVAVSTYHAAKGLEWDTVFLPGLADELMPGNRRDKQLEEMRRLMYVGITRARHKLYMSCPQFMTLNQFKTEPQQVSRSRFIKESLG